MMNDRFEAIAGQLKNAGSVLLVTHEHMDGDALGSCCALAHILREMGKECWVLLEDSIPANLQFLDRGYCTWEQNVIPEPDVSVCLDCSEPSRFPKREDAFRKGKVTICLDHHRTASAIWDMNHIEPAASSSGVLVYQLILAMGQTIDKEAGEALFAAITTDTGNYQYSNTTGLEHEVTARLYDAGIDSYGVSVQLYENKRLQRILLEAGVLSKIRISEDGRVALCKVTQELLRESGASMEETEGIAAQMRSIAGVEIAALLKEDSPDTIKVSLRAKNLGDVAAIASAFGGGGHAKAAGCTLYCGMEEAEELIWEKALENLK